MEAKDAEKIVYAFRNDLWKVGGELAESASRKDQRMGELIHQLGSLLAYHYEEKPEAIYDDSWRASMRESMKGSVAFAQSMRLD